MADVVRPARRTLVAAAGRPRTGRARRPGRSSPRRPAPGTATWSAATTGHRYHRGVRRGRREARPHRHSASSTDTTARDGHGHDHSDPATKNAISRSLEDGEDDPGPDQLRREDHPGGRGRRRPADPRARADHHPAARAPHRPPRGPLRHGRRLLHPRRRRRAAVLPGDRPRPLPPLRRRSGGSSAAAGGKAAEPGDDTVWRATRDGDRTTLTNRGTPLTRRRPDRVPADPDRRLRALPRVAGQRHRGAVRRRLALPGGARLRRRPHPRHGLRVPRRRRPLRQAVGPVRRAVRPRRLPRPPDRHQPARGRALRASRPTTRWAGRRSPTGRRPTR